MNFEAALKETTAQAVQAIFETACDASGIQTNFTIEDFEGDITLLMFPLIKISKKGPEETGNLIGAYLKEQLDFVESYNTVKGFLNIKIKDTYWLQFIHTIDLDQYGRGTPKQDKTLIEFCGPNTNKPLHLGHLRNMFIGASMANILAENGYQVTKININNDRGIAICKSMLAYKKWGNGTTPASTGKKGDHFVGDFYVLFDQENEKQVQELVQQGIKKEEAKNQTALAKENSELLLKWEAGDEETIALWRKMNGWVYEGFQETFDRLDISFDKQYYESKEYLKGKDFVLEGLKKGVFYKKENGAICADLTSFGLDEKVLLRADGSSIYLTQDLGMIESRYEDYHMDKMIYVVMYEQNYHFKVLQTVLKQLNMPYADSIYHLSYGEVKLPEGRMKSREGRVVDADELLNEVVHEAAEKTIASGKVEDMPDSDRKVLFEKIGQAAIRYFFLKVNPKKDILFNPAQSVELQGDTGPFIQYSYARIQSVIAKFPDQHPNANISTILDPEKDIIMHLYKYPAAVEEAGRTYDPSIIAQYVFHLAKLYNRFYNELKILKADTEEEKKFRIYLSNITGIIIKRSLNLLCINVPERM
jgi:arginyl-tRNA synthetase